MSTQLLTEFVGRELLQRLHDLQLTPRTCLCSASLQYFFTKTYAETPAELFILYPFWSQDGPSTREQLLQAKAALIPGGTLFLVTLGPQTLGGQACLDMHHLGDALVQTQWHAPVVDRDLIQIELTAGLPDWPEIIIPAETVDGILEVIFAYATKPK